MGIVETLPVQRVRPILCLPLWLGTLRDASGNALHPSQLGSVYWKTIDAADRLHSYGNGRLQINHDPLLDLDKGTIYIHGRITRNFLNQVWYRKNGSSNRFQFYSSNGSNIAIYDGVTFSGLNIAYAGKTSIAATWVDGAVPKFYLSGLHVGNGNLAVTATGTDQALNLLGDGGALTGCENEVSFYSVWPDVLTAAEIAELHYYGESCVTPRKQWPGAGLRLPGRETDYIADGMMEESGTTSWLSWRSAVLSKVSTAKTGSQGLKVEYGGQANCAAYQNITTAGERYRVTGWARGDGTYAPQVQASGIGVLWAGSSTAEWQQFDIFYTAQGVSLLFYTVASAAGGHAIFDDIKVWADPVTYTAQDGDPLYRDNLQTARVSLGNETAGQLSNTGYTIHSGSWQVKEDSATGERWIECVSAGFLSRPNLEAYGTWEFEFYRDTATDTSIRFVANNQIATAFPSTADPGYFIYGLANRRLALRWSASGYLFYTTINYVSDATRYRIRVTRSAAGEFTTHIRGGVFADWTLVNPESGTNPVTNNTVIDSRFLIVNMGTGNRLYLDKQFAGVNAP